MVDVVQVNCILNYIEVRKKADRRLRSTICWTWVRTVNKILDYDMLDRDPQT